MKKFKISIICIKKYIKRSFYKGTFKKVKRDLQRLQFDYAGFVFSHFKIDSMMITCELELKTW